MRDETGRTPSAREARPARMEREHEEIMARVGPTGTGFGPRARRARLERVWAEQDREREARQAAADLEVEDARRYAIREP